MDYKVVFFDIDGTLVDETKQVPQDTIDAIAQLQANGIEAVIATGRAPYFFKPIAEQLGIDSFVSLNGAYAVYQGETVYKFSIPREHLELLVKEAAKNNHSLVFEGGETYFSNVEDHPHMVDSVASLRVDFPGYDPDFWQKEDIYQVFLHCTPEDEHLYENIFPDLRLVRWHPTAMDVMPVGGSKARGIEAMLQKLNIPIEQTAAFGDGLNDKEMLETVGLGIAMGNSHPDLKPFADYVTTDVDKGGIASALRHFGLI
ncbi:Cof-type HAD-IIB family hydrolase [Paenibacillus sp. JX-17]|uniref:Cof-type HAD-IIB family hydrolase n=1 Tax=Paenibacillus lacisoli TaxID=3064525 RepID=A0ABT9CK42_9BACL|nr:Cof-type HAD-IIB family hydrolase [Paenibacillus sp. JX-17]MDO7908292.1 Cof-type HAD-IIB family hydrolase [Paenibacillus sp. JX-17]